jgi:hypothetical protein
MSAWTFGLCPAASCSAWHRTSMFATHIGGAGVDCMVESAEKRLSKSVVQHGHCGLGVIVSHPQAC